MQKRRYTRSTVWPNTGATIKVRDPVSFNKLDRKTVTGKVENMGSGGMFLSTDELINVPGFADITINFDSNPGISDLMIKASGRTVRLDKKGVGIEFTSIDLKELQECIITKINNFHISQRRSDAQA